MPTMAKKHESADDDKDSPKAKKSKTRTAELFLTGLAAVGLLGFGVGSFSSRSSSIGSVGDVTLSTNDYARALRQQADLIRQQAGAAIDSAELMRSGLGERVLSELIGSAALDNEAQKIGISASDSTVAAAVRAQPAFLDNSGAFDRERYRQVLQQNGWTEGDYEEMLRKSIGREILLRAAGGTLRPPPILVDTIFRHTGEKRDISMIRLTEADLASPPAELSDQELRAYYDAHIDAFTRPKAKRIKYALLLPRMIATDQPVDEKALRQIYEQNIGDYVTPERRLVERLVFPDAETRDEAMTQIKSGATFEAIVKERGLDLDATDLGDVTENDLGAAGAAVFAAADGAVIPAESDLGPALFRINGILQKQEITFKEARDELAAESRHEAARSAIAQDLDQIDDLLAEGDTLDDLAAAMKMQTGSIIYAPGQPGDSEIETYQAFRDAADQLQEGDYAEAINLDDGGVVVIEMVEDLPAAPIPFEEIRDKVRDAASAAAMHEALVTEAESFRTRARDGTPLNDLGTVEQARDLGRGNNARSVPPALIPEIFSMSEGEFRVVDLKGADEGDLVALIHLDKITPPAETGAEADQARNRIADALGAYFTSDASAAFLDTVARKAGIQIDRNIVNQLNEGM